MKGVKWFIVCLTLLGLCVPSFLISSDVSALKYQISTLPYLFPQQSYTTSDLLTNNSFYLETSNDYSDSNLFKQYAINLKKSSDETECIGVSTRNLPSINLLSNDRTSFSFGMNGFDSAWNVPFNYNPCYAGRVDFPINNTSIRALGSYNQSNSPTPEDLLALLPYRFHSSGIYRTDFMRENGLDYDTKFEVLFDIFGDEPPTQIYKMNIPFGPSPVSLDNNTPIEFSGEFVITFNNPIEGDLNNYFQVDTFRLKTYYIQAVNSYSAVTSSCDFWLDADDPEDPWSAWGLNYTCPYTIGQDYNGNYDPSTHMVYFVLETSYDYPSVDSFSLNSLIFDSSISVTNNDYTPGGEWGTPIIGSQPDSGLGSASRNPLIDDDSTPNYESSLTNMFAFNFFNPFTPLFAMFLDNDSCVNIPTIAGMIHSEETTICPWFDSNTRNIVTPVLGLSSMMLVFGFAVRWLGARSGNFFEDSGSIEGPGTGRDGDTLGHHGWRVKR